MDRRIIHVWGTQGRKVGAGSVFVATLLAAIAAVEPDGSVELLAAIVIGAVGVILGIGGGVAALMTTTLPLTDAHIETLHASALFVMERLAEERVCDYGPGHKVGQAFHAHFPNAGAKIDEWDALVEAHEAWRDALKDRVTEEAGKVAIFSGAHIGASTLSRGIFDLVLSRAYRGELDVPFTFIDCAPDTLKIQRKRGVSFEEQSAFEETMVRRVQTFGQDAQGWPETTETAACYQRLEAFKKERRVPLVEDLQLIRERLPEYAGKCPTCSGSAG